MAPKFALQDVRAVNTLKLNIKIVATYVEKDTRCTFSPDCFVECPDPDRHVVFTEPLGVPGK